MTASTTPGRGTHDSGATAMLASLITRLQRAGLLADNVATTFEPLHELQKHAYIAKTLGVGLDYEFEFLENGAFSPMLGIDACDLAVAGGTLDPFGGIPGAFETFVALVEGRGRLWLQATTFALRDFELDDTDDEFAARVMHASRMYEKKMLKRVFAHVREHMGKHMARAR